MIFALGKMLIYQECKASAHMIPGLCVLATVLLSMMCSAEPPQPQPTPQFQSSPRCNIYDKIDFILLM